MSYLLRPLIRPFDFAGRSRRREFWRFLPLCVACVAGAALWDARVLRAEPILGAAGPATLVILLGLGLPLLALLARRLHDIGRPSAWLMIGLLPIVGQLWLLAILTAEGERGANRYGVDPKPRPLGSAPLSGLFGA